MGKKVDFIQFEERKIVGIRFIEYIDVVILYWQCQLVLFGVELRGIFLRVFVLICLLLCKFRVGLCIEQELYFILGRRGVEEKMILFFYLKGGRGGNKFLLNYVWVLVFIEVFYLVFIVIMIMIKFLFYRFREVISKWFQSQDEDLDFI